MALLIIISTLRACVCRIVIASKARNGSFLSISTSAFQRRDVDDESFSGLVEF